MGFMPCVFDKKRGAIILTLLAVLALSAAAPQHVVADPYQGVSLDDPVGGGGGTGVGDPDQPDGSGKSNRVAQGRIVIGSQNLVGRVAGDDSSSRGVWMWRWYAIRMWQRSVWLLP
jgi:hypothetical protein